MAIMPAKFLPAHIEAMHIAYINVCEMLHSSGKLDNMSEIVAESIISFASAGETDADQLASRVLADLGGPRRI